MARDDLIARYIYAVTRRLPPKRREAVRSELAATIQKALDSRLNGQEATESDQRVVLLELGSPAEVAANYNPGRNAALIGEPHFSAYKLALGIVLGAVALGLSVAALLNAGNGTQGGALAQLGQWALNLFNGALQTFAWVTLIFAVLYRLGTPLNVGEKSLDDLPDLPAEGGQISRVGAIIGLILTIFFGVLFYLLPQTNLPVYAFTAHPRPLFNAAALSAVRVFTLIAFVGALLRCSVRLIDRRHSVLVLISSLLSDAAWGLFFWQLLSRADLINPALPEELISRSGAVGLARFLQHIGQYTPAVLWVIGALLLIDAVVVAVKTWRARKR